MKGSFDAGEKKHQKLDTKNKKIISLLLENSRMAFTEIAHKVGLSKESVQYRFKQLIEKDHILLTYPEIDFWKLGYRRYHILLLLDESDQEKQKEFIESLHNNKSVIRVLEFSDHWDLEITVLAKNLHDFDRVAEKILAPHEGLIQNKEIEAEIDRMELHSFPEFKTVLDNKVIIEGTGEKSTYDEYDLKILKLLSKDARMSTYKMIKSVGLSADAIGLRIKKLQKKEIIKKFTCMLNFSAFSYQGFTFCFNTACLTRTEANKFFYYASESPNIIAVKRMLGTWDVKSYLVVKDPSDFHQLIKDIKAKFGRNIRSYETWVIYKEHLFNPFPEILLKSYEKKESKK